MYWIRWNYSGVSNEVYLTECVLYQKYWACCKLNFKMSFLQRWEQIQPMRTQMNGKP